MSEFLGRAPGDDLITGFTGRGGLATAYRAHDRARRRHAVLKGLRPDAAATSWSISPAWRSGCHAIHDIAMERLAAHPEQSTCAGTLHDLPPEQLGGDTIGARANRGMPHAENRSTRQAGCAYHRTRFDVDGMNVGDATEPLDPESTQSLLLAARSGDDQSLNRLMERCVPPLRRWSHGRLPPYARSMNDTMDVVQDAVYRCLTRLDGFEPRHEGALMAYLRTVVLNRIRDLIKEAVRRPVGVEIPENLSVEDTSPLEAAIGAENTERYERALAALRDEDREAIVLRLELHYSYEELQVALDKKTPGAARLAVRRALERLALAMAGAPS